jgi:hypothetical protein
MEGSHLTGSRYPQPPSQQPQYQPPPAYEQPPYGQPPYTIAPPKKKKLPLGLIIGVLIVILVVLGVIFVIAGLSTKATLIVNVTNYNYYDIDYELYIDGELEDSDTLAAGYYMEYTLPMYPGSECRTYHVSATSTGGGQTESDSESVRLCAGETKVVDLHV